MLIFMLSGEQGVGRKSSTACSSLTYMNTGAPRIAHNNTVITDAPMTHMAIAPPAGTQPAQALGSGTPGR